MNRNRLHSEHLLKSLADFRPEKLTFKRGEDELALELGTNSENRDSTSLVG